MNMKQKKIKIEPRIKLNYNIYINLINYPTSVHSLTSENYDKVLKHHVLVHVTLLDYRSLEVLIFRTIKFLKYRILLYGKQFSSLNRVF